MHSPIKFNNTYRIYNMSVNEEDRMFYCTYVHMRATSLCTPQYKITITSIHIDSILVAH